MISENEVTDRIQDLLAKNGGSVEFSYSDPAIAGMMDVLNKAKFRSGLTRLGISVSFNKDSQIVAISKHGATVAKKSVEATPENKASDISVPRVKRTSHTYVPPKFMDDVVALLTDEVPHNIWFVGATGSGKTEFVHYLGNHLKRKVYQINSRRDMESAGFFGDKTVDIDPETKQNYIKFMEGMVIKSMKEGLDENGNEVGPAGILFIDEVSCLPSSLLIGLNRILETRNPRREVALDGDYGRVVRSHSAWRIICAANTVGRGLTGSSASSGLYTAQADALDISTLNRFSATFRFGYNKVAEKHILQEKTGDDRITDMVIKFRDAIRDHIKQGALSTPFSTRDIVAIADVYRRIGNLSKAINYAIMNRLPADERAVYNETAVTLLGEDIIANTGKMYGDMDDID